MSLSILFWFLYILTLVFGLAFGHPPGQPYTYRHWGTAFLLFVLVGILGWALFGPAVHLGKIPG